MVKQHDENQTIYHFSKVENLNKSPVYEFKVTMMNSTMTWSIKYQLKRTKAFNQLILKILKCYLIY